LLHCRDVLIIHPKVDRYLAHRVFGALIARVPNGDLNPLMHPGPFGKQAGKASKPSRQSQP
jgi:hypothetical protein